MKKFFLTTSLLLVCALNVQALHWHEFIESETTHVECTLNHSADTSFHNDTKLQLSVDIANNSAQLSTYSNPVYQSPRNQALIRAPPFIFSS